MARNTIQTDIYTQICNYYEGSISYKTLVERCADTVEHHSFYSAVLDSVKIGEMDLEEVHKLLLSSFSDPELRLVLLHLLGFRPREADALFERSGYFHGGGKKGIPVRLTVEDALELSPFLEVPVSCLLPHGKLTSIPSDAPWYKWRQTEGDWQQWLDSNQALLKEKFIVSGTVDVNVSRVSHAVGLCVWACDGFKYLSISVQEPTDCLDSNFQDVLISISKYLQWNYDFCAHTVSRQFLNIHSPIHIHGLSIWDHQNPRLRARLYSRILSPRVEEFSIITDKDVHTIKRPWFRRNDTYRAIREFITIRNAPLYQRFLAQLETGVFESLLTTPQN